MKNWCLFFALTLAVVLGTSVSRAQETGFQFVLVVTHAGDDVVLMNDDIPGREFSLGEMGCKASLKTMTDPIYPDQTLGSLILDCLHRDFPIQTSVTCSRMDNAAQNHFEFGLGEHQFSFDLLCKAKAR